MKLETQDEITHTNNNNNNDTKEREGERNREKKSKSRFKTFLLHKLFRVCHFLFGAQNSCSQEKKTVSRYWHCIIGIIFRERKKYEEENK